MVLSVSFSKLQLPPNATGPLAVAFDVLTAKFFTGLHDGRILKYTGPTTGFVDFGYTAPNRPNSCNGLAPTIRNRTCGRPLGLALDQNTKMLYICNQYYGFAVLGPNGGQATIISTSADGQPYRSCVSVDVNQRTKNVFFTDFSAIYNLSQGAEAIRNNDSTGRVLKFDIKTKQVTVLFKNLSGATGVAADRQERFILASEYIANRTLKIWLRGSNATKFDIINRQPRPHDIRRTDLGRFWIAAAMVNRTQSLVPVGVRISDVGRVLQTVDFERWYGNEIIDQVKEFRGKLYESSYQENFIGVYRD
ncbi:hypothetical protein PTKIN_Ptkin05aG0187700 [Pterospermum kingtungense]